MLFEGTDVDIEGELLKASGVVPRSSDVVDKLLVNFNLPIEFANAAYFQNGTPRYLSMSYQSNPLSGSLKMKLMDISTLFSMKLLTLDKLKSATADVEEAIIYAYFKHVDQIIDHVWMLDKLAYVQNVIDSSDKVAQREIKSLMLHERSLLNANVLDVLYNYNEEVAWIYRGQEVVVASKTTFNKWLSQICEEVYSATPIFINEMVNKHKPSGTMSAARVNLLSRLLEYSSDPNLGFEDNKFPPEKTIFMTLLKNTGILGNI